MIFISNIYRRKFFCQTIYSQSIHRFIFIFSRQADRGLWMSDFSWKIYNEKKAFFNFFSFSIDNKSVSIVKCNYYIDHFITHCALIIHKVLFLRWRNIFYGIIIFPKTNNALWHQFSSLRLQKFKLCQCQFFHLTHYTTMQIMK